MYRLFEHTADIGIHAEADDRNSLFADAARGLFAIITSDIEKIRSIETVEVRIDGTDHQYLMLDWLTELLVTFEIRRLLLGKFDVDIDDTGLTATAHGEAVDFSRYRLTHEVKAITYHGLKVEQTDRGWTADIIVDI